MFSEMTHKSCIVCSKILTCKRCWGAQVNVTLIATGFGEGASTGPTTGWRLAAVQQDLQPQHSALQDESAVYSHSSAAADTASRERVGGVQIPAFLRKRRERGK